MVRVVLYTGGHEREEGHIDFTDLLAEHASDWAYKCQPSGLLTFEQVREIVEQILLRPGVNSGTVGKFHWEKPARTATDKQFLS